MKAEAVRLCEIISKKYKEREKSKFFIKTYILGQLNKISEHMREAKRVKNFKRRRFRKSTSQNIKLFKIMNLTRQKENSDVEQSTINKVI